jgi:hypothetical protein
MRRAQAQPALGDPVRHDTPGATVGRVNVQLPLPPFPGAHGETGQVGPRPRCRTSATAANPQVIEFMAEHPGVGGRLRTTTARAQHHRRPEEACRRRPLVGLALGNRVRPGADAVVRDGSRPAGMRVCPRGLTLA